MKVAHIITGLNTGGAEMMLYKFLKNKKNGKNIHIVISMANPEGRICNLIRELGIDIYSLEMKKGSYSIKKVLECKRLCKDVDVVQSWMYHANLLGFIVSKLIRKRNIWGIHHSNLEKGKNSKKTIMIAKVLSFLSNFVYKIIFCGPTTMQAHLDIGYNSKNSISIPNGFDSEEFYYIDDAKEILRKEGINLKNKIVLLLIGRYNILKDHRNCLKALFILKKEKKELLLILCGNGINEENANLMKDIEEFSLKDDVVLMGERSDIPLIMSASDIYVSSSSGEGFPNVIGEAMLCELPCVVTDVGDSGYIVGDTGVIVEKENSEDLAKGINKILDKEIYRLMKKDCRKRIIVNFDINDIVHSYEKLL